MKRNDRDANALVGLLFICCCETGRRCFKGGFTTDDVTVVAGSIAEVDFEDRRDFGRELDLSCLGDEGTCLTIERVCNGEDVRGVSDVGVRARRACSETVSNDSG